MEKENEYMSVGQLAEKMHTTVRTLQYYDREGSFGPARRAAAAAGCILIVT